MSSQPLLVIKVGGDLLESGATLETTAASIAATQRAGYRVVVVHGGGSAIARLASALGLEERKVDGLRVTDAATAEVALAVLAGTQGKSLAAALGRQGCEAVSVALIEDLLAKGRTPLIAPMAPLASEHEEPGSPLHNINADTAAGPIAQALQADALLFVTNVEGVLDGDGKCLRQLDRGTARHLQACGVLSAGMLPKIEAALDAAQAMPGARIRIAGTGPDSAPLHTLIQEERGTLICPRKVVAHG